MSPLLIIKNSLKDFFLKEEKDNKYNYFALAVAAGIGHIFFGIYWTYIDPQLYESFYLRSLGFLTCLILLIAGFVKRYDSQNKNLYRYWIFAVIYNLPFFFTVNLIRNNFSDIWFVAEATMIFTTVLFLTNIIPSLLAIFTGIFFAIIFCFFTNPESLYFNHEIVKHLPIYFLTFIASYVFSYSNSKGLALSKKARHKKELEILESLGGTIAHEVRNPLSIIKILGQEVKDLAADLTNNSNLDKEIIKTKLLEFNAEINRAIKRANDIIEITLKDIKGQKFDTSTFSYLSAANVINTAIDEYGYKNDEERKKVKFLDNKTETEKDFIFKGDETLLIYVLFNLIKNALYYTEKYPNSIITISIQKADEKNIVNDNQSESKHFNQIIIRDEGPGVPKDKLESIFEPFNTSGKVGGTGLGLPFCKRTMKTLQGEIFCRSEFGKYTEFVLLLPILSNEELEIAKQQINQKQQKPIRILIVDDQETNLKTNKAILKKGLNNVICDITKDGKEALEMFKAKNQESSNSRYYDIILTDIEMPVMNGMEFSKEIRKFDAEIPIISYTSNLTDEIKENSRKAGIDDFLEKPISHNYLIKTLCKWTLSQYNHEDHIQRQIDEMLKEILQGKRLLLADDEMVNRMLLAKSLKSYGLEVESISDGDELLEKYQENAKDNLVKKYDIILTDINMQKLNGDLAAIKIREFESKNNIQNPVPIIAYSGDGDVKDIRKFLRAGMDDYFIKGNDVKTLIDNIVFWIIAHDKNLQSRLYLLEQMQLKQLKKETEEEKSKIETVNLNPDSISSSIPNLNSLPIFNNRLDKEILNEVKDTFIKDLSRLFAEIKKSFEDQNIKDFYFHTHALKGIAGNIGAERLCVYVTYINDYSKKDQFPKEDGWLELLQNIMNEAERFLK